MRCLRPFILLAVCLVALALTAGPAAAESPVIRDCYADRGQGLTHHYSVAQLRNALATIPADIKEYTDCYTVIQDQLYRQLGTQVPGARRSSKQASSGSVISTPLLVILIVVVVGGGGLAYASWRRGGGGTPPPAAD